MTTICKEHIRFRKLIFSFAKTNLIKTYRGSVLGWYWALVNPLIRIFVFWFAFSIGLRSGGPKYGYPFFIWLVAGLLPWFYMNEMLIGGAKAIRSYKHLVTKMTFPVSIIPTFVSLSALMVHFVLTLIVIVIFAFLGYFPDIYLLQLPFYSVLMFFFFTRWSLFAAPLSAISIDFQSLVRSLVTAIFWLSGILWDPETIDIVWIKYLLKINPITFFVEGYRNVFVKKVWFFEDFSFLYFFCVLLLLIFISSRVYNKLRTDLADVL